MRRRIHPSQDGNGNNRQPKSKSNVNCALRGILGSLLLLSCSLYGLLNHWWWSLSIAFAGKGTVPSPLSLRHDESEETVVLVENLLVAANASQLPNKHPHAGAVDEFGNRNYIHDPYYVKNHALSLSCRSNQELSNRNLSYSICEAPFGQGLEQEGGYKVLQRIRIHNDTSADKHLRLLCMVYTHSAEEHILRAVVETYAPHCDGFMAASDVTKPSLGAVKILHHGPESYENMWQKIRSMLAYAYDHYRNQFDLFHVGGGDMYIIPENLKYMASLAPFYGADTHRNHTWFLGGPMVAELNRVRMCAGGTGYTLHRDTLELVVTRVLPTCFPFKQSSREDRILSRCLRKLDIHCANTNDSQNRTRFHGGDAQYRYDWNYEQRDHRKSKQLKHHFGIETLEGIAGVSPSTVSFHLRDFKDTGNADQAMHRYHAILYGLCGNHQACPESLASHTTVAE